MKHLLVLGCTLRKSLNLKWKRMNSNKSTILANRKTQNLKQRSSRESKILLTLANVETSAEKCSQASSIKSQRQFTIKRTTEICTFLWVLGKCLRSLALCIKNLIVILRIFHRRIQSSSLQRKSLWMKMSSIKINLEEFRKLSLRISIITGLRQDLDKQGHLRDSKSITLILKAILALQN